MKSVHVSESQAISAKTDGILGLTYRVNSVHDTRTCFPSGVFVTSRKILRKKCKVKKSKFDSFLPTIQNNQAGSDCANAKRLSA